MEYSFYFESKFRTRRNVNYLRIQVPDGTEFVLSEEWMVSTQRNKRTPMQRLIFLKRNNYGNIYRITVEVSSSTNSTSGKRVFSRRTKPLRTSIIILMADYRHLSYPTQETVTYEDVEVCERVIRDTFKYKTTIIRLDASQKENERTSEPDKILIMPYQLLFLLKTGDFSDIIIAGKCSVHGFCEIKAHSNILAARSTYFNSMINNQWRETKDKRIVINETDMILITEMLHFIYSGVIRPMKFSVMFDLYRAAHMYLLNDLIKQLSNELVKHLNAENSVGIYNLACFFFDKSLEDTSLNFIRNNFNTVQVTEFWRSLPHNQDSNNILTREAILERIS